MGTADRHIEPSEHSEYRSLKPEDGGRGGECQEV